MSNAKSFQEFVLSRAGRVQVGWWMAGTGLAFAICFGVFAWYAEADVPILFWPIIAGGGALLGLHFLHLRWQAGARKRGKQ